MNGTADGGRTSCCGVRYIGGVDGEDPRVPRQRLHRRPARPVLQAQQVRVPLDRRTAAGRGVTDELRPARRTLPAARRRHRRLRPAHVRRARHLQVDGQLLATQAQQELLEESVDDVLEPGTSSQATCVRYVAASHPAPEGRHTQLYHVID